jgi:hypothetical protein
LKGKGKGKAKIKEKQIFRKRAVKIIWFYPAYN